MLLERRVRWLLLSGLVSMVASEATDYLMTKGFRAARRVDPPEDLAYRDVDWRQALLWTAGVGALVGMTEVLARHGADLAWRRVTGTEPPRRRKRPRYKSRRQALTA